MNDVIVIGAGLSGMMAARKLTQHGLKVTVVEARDRVGGRTWSKAEAGDVFDVGGQWFGPDHKRFSGLVEEFDLKVAKTYHDGRKVLDLHGKLSTYTGTIPRISPWTLIRTQMAIWKVERECRKVDLVEPWNDPRAAQWDSQTVHAWMQRKVRNKSVIALINAAARVIFGSDLSELSLLHFLHYLHSGGGLTKLIETHEGNQDSAIIGGAQSLSRAMAGQLDNVVLSAPVRRIEQNEQRVLVITDAGQFEGRRAIVTIPPPFADRICYLPRLTTLRDQMTQRSSMGATIKVYALYDEPFWRADGFSGESVSTVGPVGVTFDNVTAAGQAALLSFVVGAPARGWAERPAGDRRQIVLSTLGRYFGKRALSPTHYFETDWADEAWSGGAPVAVFPPGTLSVFGTALRAPIGLLHWAGTETAGEFTGFMEGALESGERVAAEVVEALG
jgi:monoamine oxidase